MIVAGEFDLCMFQETKNSKNAAGQSSGLLGVWKAGVIKVQFSF